MYTRNGYAIVSETKQHDIKFTWKVDGQGMIQEIKDNRTSYYPIIRWDNMEMKSEMKTKMKCERKRWRGLKKFQAKSAENQFQYGGTASKNESCWRSWNTFWFLELLKPEDLVIVHWQPTGQTHNSDQITRSVLKTARLKNSKTGRKVKNFREVSGGSTDICRDPLIIHVNHGDRSV